MDYLVGDVQGCCDALDRLLAEIDFSPSRDHLVLVGDLVNRGPGSLATLKRLRGLGDAATCLLGNHDLHLLAFAGGAREMRKDDTVRDVLEAPDRDELLDWLRHRKLMHAGAGYAMVHAGLLPQWSISKALALAREVETALQSNACDEFLLHLYGNRPDRWRDDLTGIARLRVITNVMTRLRICTVDGRMEFAHTGKPVDLPKGFMPWYTLPRRRSRGTPVIFGHWAALGLYTGSNVFALDTGCVWGRALSALRLSDRQLFQHACAARARPARRQ
jgi:bis(5'-nucleosyl)-tetraphosphatase (symmetrical)